MDEVIVDIVPSEGENDGNRFLRFKVLPLPDTLTIITPEVEEEKPTIPDLRARRLEDSLSVVQTGFAMDNVRIAFDERGVLLGHNTTGGHLPKR